MNVPMVRKTTDEGGNVTEEDFTLNSLEVIGRIDPEGLDIEVSMPKLLSLVKIISNFFPSRPAAAT